jgi:hypothetical protein
MRQTVIVAVLTAAITAFITAWGTTLIMASGSKKLSATGTSFALDVTAITRAAQNLPLQQFDAF